MNLWKLAGAIGGVVLSLIGGCIGVTVQRAGVGLPETPYPPVSASSDPSTIERGRYLVYGPAQCSGCHIPTDKAFASGPGGHPDLIGGLEFEMPGFGTVRTPNLTPDEEFGIGEWTDGELARMVRYGVGRDGTVSLEMKFVGGRMSDEDLVAIVSYLRASEPKKVERKRSEHSFVYKVLVAWFFDPLKPDAAVPDASPTMAPTVERGEYLANGPANCVGCHSQINPMDLSLSRKFGGGDPVPDVADPAMEFAAPNITMGGRVGSWSEDDFVTRFRLGKLLPSSGMPWGPFSNMTDDDLRAIYRYLRSVPALDYDPGPNHRESGWKP